MSRLKLLALVLSLIPLCLSAQESPPSDTKFHGGQWAMQFGGGSSLFSLGVLHFTSARSAWILDLATSVTVLDGQSTDKVGGTTTAADQQSLNVDVRIGKRFYQTPPSKVVSFQTIAIEGGWADQMVDVSAGNVRQTIWNVGLNGELGGAYMLTSSVSLGGTAMLSAGYVSLKRDNPIAREESTGFYSGIRVMIALGLYF